MALILKDTDSDGARAEPGRASSREHRGDARAVSAPNEIQVTASFWRRGPIRPRSSEWGRRSIALRIKHFMKQSSKAGIRSAVWPRPKDRRARKG